MSVLRKVIHWFLVIFFFFCMLGGFLGGSPVAGVLFLIALVLMLPLEGLPWNKITRGKRALKYLICLILMIISFGLLSQQLSPGKGTSSQTDMETQLSSSDGQESSETEESSEAEEHPASGKTERGSGENSTSAEGKTAESTQRTAKSGEKVTAHAVSLSDIPAYSGEPYVTINDDEPFFYSRELKTEAFEHYSRLDALGRCGVAYANVCRETMPTEKRGAIGSVHPSGWHTVKYSGIDGNYLYNRCHLIGYQLSAENANARNLITGTRYLNTEGMLPFENMVADYIKETGNHVLYRVTPMFKGNNLVASGVLMEAESVEDKGEGISFNVFCYNVQPGITIDYSDGSSSGKAYRGSSSGSSGGSTAAGSKSAASSGSSSAGTSSRENEKKTVKAAGSSHNESTAAYIGNANTMVFHYAGCSSVSMMSESNKVAFHSRKKAIRAGYRPCERCNP